jgi:hypothetical protein
MINSLTGGLEFPEKKFISTDEESDIDRIEGLDINANYNPVPSL